MQVFRDLITRFPVSADLEAFLESKEGGRLQINDRAEGVCLIRYEKGLSDFSLPHVRWFRSVIWDTKQNRPLAVAPPRKTAVHTEATATPVTPEGVQQPLLDGVMLNVWVRGTAWGMATRSRLGASGYFYSSKPFSQLFLEGLQGFHTLEEFVGSLQAEENTVFYSFLLQHIENRTVTPYTENAVYVIHKGIVDAEGGIEWDDFPAPPRGTRAVQHASPLPPLSWVDQGRVWRDGKGGRVVERSDAWKHVKMLRGNDASDVARFLRLYHAGVLAEYLGYYPEEEPFMRHHAQWMHVLTQRLLDTYRSVFVRRIVKRSEVDQMWWPHLYELQGSYMKTKKSLLLFDVAEYLRIAPWHRVAHLLRKLQSYQSDFESSQ